MNVILWSEPEYWGRHRREDGPAEGVCVGGCTTTNLNQSGRHHQENTFGIVTKVVECEEDCWDRLGANSLYELWDDGVPSRHYHLFNVKRTGLKGNQ